MSGMPCLPGDSRVYVVSVTSCVGRCRVAVRRTPQGEIEPPPSVPPRAVFVFYELRLHTGGLTKAWLRRLRLFAAAGWDVHVALLKRDPDLRATVRALRADGRLPASVALHQFSRDPRMLPRLVFARLARRSHRGVMALWLDRLASRSGALVFAETPLTYPLLARMRNPRAARVYMIHLAHLSAAATRLPTALQAANGPLTTRFARLSDATMRAADRIVVATEGQRRDFLMRWGPDLPVAVIPFPAYPTMIPPERPYDLRLVVVVGRLDYFKRLDDALRTMARVLAKVPDARLEIYGVGADLERLRSIAEKLGIAGSVIFRGYTTDPLGVMAGAACMISTTRREAMGLTVLESLSVGTPAVVNDIRYGPGEIVRDGVDGFVVPAGDLKAAARAVIRLLTDSNLRARMSQAAREVTTRYSVAAHEQAWLALGREVYLERVGPIVPTTPPPA